MSLNNEGPPRGNGPVLKICRVVRKVEEVGGVIAGFRFNSQTW